MNDTVATQAVLERPSQGGQVERVNEQAQGSTDGQPSSQDGQAEKERENIRKLQSTYDQKLAAQAQQLRQYQQQYQALQQQFDQMQEQAAPDDYARLEIKLQRAEQRAAQYEAQLQAEYQAKEAANARSNALAELADKYGVSAKELEGATDYLSAVELAIEARDKRKQRQQQDDDDKRERNRVDVGGGRISTPSTRWDEEYEEAVRSKDTLAQIRLLRERGN